jgi:DNA end-binding protein Ku
LGKEAVEIEAFVDEAAIPPQYFEKPYVLTPGKKAEKGYVLLRQTLKSTGKIGIGRVVIRAREYLCAVMPQGDALLLLLLRFEEELVDISEYKLPAGNAGEYRVSEKELAMAKQLIGSMADKWQPDKFHDEFEARLGAVIKKRLKTKGAIASNVDKKSDVDEDATTNVVDFMSLLQKSLASNKRTPAKASKAAAKKPAKTTAKAATKSAAAKKTAARRSA